MNTPESMTDLHGRVARAMLTKMRASRPVGFLLVAAAPVLTALACGSGGGANGAAGDAAARNDNGDAEAADVAPAVSPGDGATLVQEAGDALADSYAPGVVAGTGAVALLGSACTSPAALACAGNAQKVTLICSGGTWTANETCPAGQNCNSAPGPNQGTCASIDPLCATDAGPGATSCSSPSQILICGPDLLSHSFSMCANTTTCVAGACTGVCGPSQTQCSGTDIQTCDSSGQWGSPVTCYASEPAATAVIGQTCQAGVCACPSGDEECCTGGEDCACTPISSGTICE